MRKIVLFSGLYGTTAVVSKGLSFLLFIWLAKKLSVETYAKFGLLYALQTAIVTFAIAGVIEAVMGLFKQFGVQQRKDQLFPAAITTFFILASLTSAIIISGGFVYESGYLLHPTILVVISGVILAYSSFQSQLLRLIENHRFALLWNFFPTLTISLGGLAGILLQPTLSAFFIGSIGGGMLSLVFLHSFSLGNLQLHFDTFLVRKILIRVLPFVAIAFFGWVSGYGSNYFIKIFFLSGEIAKFTFALSLSAIMQLIVNSVNQVWSPHFLKIVNVESDNSVKVKNKKFGTWLSIALGLFAALVLIVYPHAVQQVGGNLLNYRFMRFELFLMMASYLILVPWYQTYNYYLVFDAGRTIMNIVTVSGICSVIVWILMMIILGPIGIYWGFFSQALIKSATIIFFARKRWDISVSWKGILAGALLMMMGLYLSYQLLPDL